MKTTLQKRITLGCIGFLASTTLAFAPPTTYFFDDSGARGGAGTGIFTIDIGSALGDFQASAVAGDGNTVGVWDSVMFRAHPGNYPGIVISNLVGATLEFSALALGGGEINSGSQADLEWENLLRQLNANGVVVRPTGIIPEASTWLSVLGIGLAGFLVARRR